MRIVRNKKNDSFFKTYQLLILQFGHFYKHFKFFVKIVKIWCDFCVNFIILVGISTENCPFQNSRKSRHSLRIQRNVF